MLFNNNPSNSNKHDLLKKTDDEFARDEEGNFPISKNKKSFLVVSTIFSFRLLMELCVCLLFAYVYVYNQNSCLESLQNSKNISIEKIELELKAIQEKYIQKTNEALECYSVLSKQKQEYGEVLKKHKVLEEEHGKLKHHSEKQIKRFKEFTKEVSLAYLLLKYPNKKSMRVKIETSEGSMLMETAPFHLLPVVVYYFLNQVEEKLWDHRAFFRAESHVIQASDMCGDCEDRESRIKHQKGIPFQEYSDQYPHHKFVLGIAGRPGGPDIYVNMMDNEKLHGPGGQGFAYNGDPDSDAAFGKLISGQEVAQKIQKLPFERKGGMHILKKLVVIQSMRVVGEEGEEGKDGEEEDLVSLSRFNNLD